MGIKRIAKVFKKAKAENRKVLIPYLTAGFPSKKRFWHILKRLSSSGADIIEIGVPFSDPIADGPVIEEASYHCLKEGVSLTWLLNELELHRKDISAELILMGYCNPFERYDWNRLGDAAATLNICGFIVPDLPLEESKEVEEVLKEKKIALIRLIGLNTPEERMKKYAEKTEGFVYFVSVLGTTGPRDEFSKELTLKLQTARKIFNHPIVIGFGAKHPSQFTSLKPYIDGIVFGSSLIVHIKKGRNPEEFIKLWKAINSCSSPVNP